MLGKLGRRDLKRLGESVEHLVLVPTTVHGTQVVVVRSRQVLGRQPCLHGLVHYGARLPSISATREDDRTEQNQYSDTTIFPGHSSSLPPRPFGSRCWATLPVISMQRCNQVEHTGHTNPGGTVPQHTFGN